MDDVPASSSSPRPSRWRNVGEDIGCFLPFVAPPVALTVGWWLGGVYVRLGSAVVVGILGLWLLRRLFGAGAFVEFGCVVLLIVIMLTLLVPAIQRIQEARERMRRKRDAGWQDTRFTWIDKQQPGAHSTAHALNPTPIVRLGLDSDN
jgi:hypothetical protein